MRKTSAKHGFKQGFRRRHLTAWAIAVSFAFLTCISICPTPAFADDDADFSDLMAQAKSIRAEIEAVRGEYLAAVQQAEDMEAMQREEERKLAEIDVQLSEARGRLGQIAREAYKTGNGMSLWTIVINAETFDEALSGMRYLQTIAEDRERIVSEIAALEREQAEIPEKLAEQRRLAEEQAVQAEAGKEVFEAKLAEMKPELDQLRGAAAARIGNSSGSSQMNQILDYLDMMGESTEAQAAIIRSAYRMTGSGGYDQRCEAFAEAVIRGAGLSMPSYISAWEDCKANMASSDMGEAKAGCLIYAAGSGYMGNLYGHVGVIVYADGDPDHIRICDSVSAGGTSQTLDEWLSWQTSVNSETGATGLFGWGYPPGYSW